MKRIVYARALAALLALGLSSAYAEEEIASAPSSQATATVISPSWLQRQIQSIAHSHEISHAKKEKRIANAVRMAINAATAYQGGNTSAVLNKAVTYATAAARVAPEYSKIITNAASFTPAVARIDGASGQIEAAVDSAATGRGRRRIAAYREDWAAEVQAPMPKKARRHHAAPALVEPAPDVVAETDDADAPPLPSAPIRRNHHVRTQTADDGIKQLARNDSPAPRVATDNPPDSTAAGEDVMPEQSNRHWEKPEIALGDNASLHLKATVSVKHDNNIYLSQEDKTSDIIYTFVPGAEFRFGQASQTHGSLSVEENFVRYGQGKAPSTQLASDSGDFGFGNDNLKFGSTGSYQQLYQTDPNVVHQDGTHDILHSSVTNWDNNFEISIASKMNLGVGFNYYASKYKHQGLYDNQEDSFPVKLYYAVTPKSDLFTGVTYSDSTVQTGKHSAKDFYYNFGARGNLTPKLSGEISAGYKTRSIGGTTDDGTLGFEGNLTYELTPKTTSALALSRGYSTSAVGQSLKDTRASLNFSTQFNSQWEGGLTFSYYTNDYGDTFLNADPTKSTDPSTIIFRRDTYKEGSFNLTYIATTWMTISGGVTYRRNNSTVQQAEFSNTLLSIILGLRY